MDPIRIQRALTKSLSGLEFAPPVTHVYNPLVHARRSAEEYLRRYAKPGVEAVWLGMNPGPFGMAQTGVPFGEVALVRDWIGIDEKVDKPADEHPKRPIQGFDCPRSEVSGRRVWSWAKARFGDPDAFFARFFVWNYCPLVFMEESGKNRTPDKLPAEEREPLYAACDLALHRMIEHLRPRMVIGVGKFAEKRAREALADLDLEFGSVLHPSPASPLANKGWEPQVEKQLAELGVSF
ncbi:MAG: single-stranded DNA-binding protein [Planctomycetes bacterium]|nr:single-stranded DNA-binding protein [Planctomycetota bacterium]